MRKASDFSFEDVEEIVDHSFTISFSSDIKAWVAEHDYYPSFFIDHPKGMFSFNNGKVFRHNTGRKGQYYDDTIYECYVESVFPYNANVLTNNVEWKTTTSINGAVQFDKTLTGLILYNDTQCSNYVEIKPFASMYDTSAFNVRGTWKLNKFSDLVLNQNLAFMQDGKLVTSNLMTQPNLFGIKHFVSNYLVCRFIFSNILECELNITDVGTNGSLDVR